jgi:hypothetical protein
MINRLVFRAVLLLFMLGLASCSSNTPTMQPAQTAGAFSVSLKVDPDPPVPMKDALMELKLLDSKGQPISGADLSFDLTMPGMKMPINHPEVIETSKGVYQANTLFSMAGKWQVQVLVTYAGETETFIFDLNTTE